MRITLNFAAAPSARDRYALAWAVPLSLLALAGLFFLSRDSLQQYREYRSMRAQLAEAQARTAEFQSQEAAIRRRFETPGTRDLLQHAKFVNALIDRRQYSLSGMAARIAGLLPEDAHLTGLALSTSKQTGEEYEVRMGIAAKNEDAVDTFINDLEDAPDFQDVSILNQGFETETSQPDSVNLVCTARYLPGVDVDKETPSAEEPTPNRQSSR